MELERGNHIANNKLYKRKRRHIRHHMITKHRKKEEESFTQTETNSRKKGRFLIAEAITLNTKTIEVLLSHSERDVERERLISSSISSEIMVFLCHLHLPIRTQLR